MSEAWAESITDWTVTAIGRNGAKRKAPTSALVKLAVADSRICDPTVLAVRRAHPGVVRHQGLGDGPEDEG